MSASVGFLKPEPMPNATISILASAKIFLRYARCSEFISGVILIFGYFLNFIVCDNAIP
ncbi:MAG: hypothetical protein J6B07_02385 [Opitutales bacterium]|nr:hypothetical protein [Opitutales bacterium]